jgi:hypothetical protein
MLFYDGRERGALAGAISADVTRIRPRGEIYVSQGHHRIHCRGRNCRRRSCPHSRGCRSLARPHPSWLRPPQIPPSWPYQCRSRRPASHLSSATTPRGPVSDTISCPRCGLEVHLVRHTPGTGTVTVNPLDQGRCCELRAERPVFDFTCPELRRAVETRPP